jgi:hypothetical protein
VYGIDLADYIGEIGDKASVVMLPAAARAELCKDDRFASVTVRSVPTFLTNGDVEIEMEVDIEPADGSEDFMFTLTASRAGVAFGGVS